MHVLGCSAPYGSGGLGQHFAHVVELARRDGHLDRYYTLGPKRGDEPGRIVPDGSRWMVRYTPLRFAPASINHWENERFDKAVAQRLEAPLESYVGFGGQSRRSFERARRLGCRRLALVAANSHVRNVARQHALARAAYPIERSWLNSAQVRNTLCEYEMADVIYVASEYTRQTFLAEGVPASKLRRLDYPTDPRFVPAPTPWPGDAVFRVVYTGGLTVAKGVPVLIEAFARLATTDAELTLVGGSGSRGMRRYLERACARDPRIRLAPGDPLPHLQRANVCVHASYDDGHGYAPMEALACGVPVIVTAHTGMKEHVREGINGYVVPTGSVDAIYERLEAISRPIARPPSLLAAAASI